jgi:hypothetical protein
LLQCAEVQSINGVNTLVLATCQQATDSPITKQLWDITFLSPIQASPPPSTPTPPSIPSPPNLSSGWVGKVVQLENVHGGCLGVEEVYDGIVVKPVQCMELPCDTPGCLTSLQSQLWRVADAGVGNVYLKEQKSNIGR